MENVIREFNERVLEIDNYFKLLKGLSDEDVMLYKKYKKRVSIKEADRLVIKVMKASAILMLYNLIESSVRASFSEIYSEINNKDMDIKLLTKVFRGIWVNQNFKRMMNSSVNQDSYKKLIAELIDHVIENNPIDLSSRTLPISGNLDAGKIRELMGKHDIKNKVHYRALGGSELETIKNQRNALAHGSISFSECGQMYGVDDLIRMKKQTVIYLRGTLKNVKLYLEKESYAA